MVDKKLIVMENYYKIDIPNPEETTVKNAYKSGFLRGTERLEHVRPHGTWLLSSIQDEEDSNNGNYLYECSNCGAGDLHSEKVYVPYCWHCGASMKNTVTSEPVIGHWLDGSDDLPPIGGFHD